MKHLAITALSNFYDSKSRLLHLQVSYFVAVSVHTCIHTRVCRSTSTFSDVFGHYPVGDSRIATGGDWLTILCGSAVDWPR